ncbi:hypothetical protein [Streptomyces hesseae]|uniref:Uncharacterized protein n=1 Tax=Streptomyces hesseae TaxID=3075519 RepID=A0ABU2T0S3_9ACTN|nr:hypothetical protein [Streptomyces sp. DSM 40473]MDT0453794.1 hypothetical protein [Streptomyces sp. DSM 40473]
MDIAGIAQALAASGLRMHAVEEPGNRMPVWAARLASHCRHNEGRRDFVINRSDPGFLEAANSAWFRLANDEGLFDRKGEFLLAVNRAEWDDELSDMVWVRVGLMDEWDIFRSHSDSYPDIFGYEGYPEFVMLSTDGNLVLQATNWDNGSMGLVLLSRPHRSATIREYAQRRKSNPSIPESRRIDGINWLRSAT